MYQQVNEIFARRRIQQERSEKEASRLREAAKVRGDMDDFWALTDMLNAEVAKVGVSPSNHQGYLLSIRETYVASDGLESVHVYFFPNCQVISHARDARLSKSLAKRFVRNWRRKVKPSEARSYFAGHCADILESRAEERAKEAQQLKINLAI